MSRTSKSAKHPLAEEPADSNFEEVTPETPSWTEKIITKNLQCRLTPEEYVTFGQELARANASAEEVEERKKQVDAQLKAEIESHATRALSLSRTINNGYVYRDVTCTQRFDYRTNTVTTIRGDLLIVIDTRAMTEAERQIGLFGESTSD